MSKKLSEEDEAIRDKLEEYVRRHQQTPKDQLIEPPDRHQFPIGVDDDGKPFPPLPPGARLPPIPDEKPTKK